MEELERDIERKCIQFFENRGIFIYKPSKFTDLKHAMRINDKGAPDCWAFYQTRAFAIEFKAIRGKLSKEQESFRARLGKEMVPYFVVRDLGDAEAVYKAIRS